jgi:hypothetical protein
VLIKEPKVLKIIITKMEAEPPILPPRMSSLTTEIKPIRFKIK